MRLIAASNRNLSEEVRAKRFRSDLYYRLNVLPVEIPPLRERPGDLRDLVQQHMTLLRGKSINEGFFESLERHSWPGNVRELIQVLKRAGIQLPGPGIGAEIRKVIMGLETVDENNVDTKIREIRTSIEDGATFWDTAWRSFLDRDLNREELQRMLNHLFEEHGCSLRRLSKALNIMDKDYPRFVSALHKYNVHPAQ